MLLLLLVVIFTGVFLAFNLFVQSFISSNVENQLEQLVDNFRMLEYKSHIISSNDINLPDITGQPKSRIGAHAEVFVLDINYKLKIYKKDSLEADISELTEISDYLRENRLSLTNARNVRINTEQNEYYISTIEDLRQPGSFMVFYVSITGINSLVNTVYFALAIIVVIAMLICFLIANTIADTVTKPVKKLSKFAEEIGKGNFRRHEFKFRDIEFDELGNAMNQAAEKLDLYDKDQRDFFQNVSHELRTPLQSIRCYAEGIEYGLMDEKKSSATIVAETDRLSELVEDLLYISRVDSITNQMKKYENDLRDTLALCAAAQKSLADKNGVKFEYVFDNNPVMFTYNEKHMYRAFSNLISNALRYAKSTVVLSCQQSDEIIAISVINDGVGIFPEDIPHIFERFYTGKGGKHGIGLSIVKAVVELHGGEVLVNCDQETCFTIRFIKG